MLREKHSVHSEQRPVLAREALNANIAEIGDSQAEFLFSFYCSLFRVLVSILIPF